MTSQIDISLSPEAYTAIELRDNNKEYQARVLDYLRMLKL